MGIEVIRGLSAAAELTAPLECDAGSVSLGDVAAAWENCRLVHDSLIAEHPAP